MKATHVKKHDVCILGAGMAGLTLARELNLRRPELDIVLVEHRRFPMPEVTHKVGESTVEIASHYLASHLGLKEHLESEQLTKFGLRFFLRGAEPIANDLAQYCEIGVSQILPISTYQLDRGRFENFLATQCQNAGIKILDGNSIQRVQIESRHHRVTLRDADAGQEQVIHSRFLVDASGRRALLRNDRGLARSARHKNHAVWFRVSGTLDIDEWSSDECWRNRCNGTQRLLSTNHFTGPGYWLWLIPLASDATSVGLVFDPNYVPLSKVRKHEDLIDWLREEHPLVAEHLSTRAPLDFHVLEGYAIGSKELFSDSGWMTTGDAAAFSDPFYSPGGDFIAFANGFITELISGDQNPSRYREYQQYFQAFFVSTMSLYRGQYGGFGDRDLMVTKTLWDYLYYWGVLSKLFFTRKFVDPKFMASVQPALNRAAISNAGVQRMFRTMSREGARIGGEGRFYDHYTIELFHQLKHDLILGDPDNAASQLESNVTRLSSIADSLGEILKHRAEGIPIRSLKLLDQTG